MRPGDSTYAVDYVIVTHEANGTSRATLDRHVDGLFRRADWLRWLAGAGFSVEGAVSDEGRDIFIATRPGVKLTG